MSLKVNFVHVVADFLQSGWPSRCPTYSAKAFKGHSYMT